MRLKSKRLVSLLLAGSMMVSMVPASAVTAFAAETNGIVSSADAIQGESVTVDSFTTGQLEAAVKALHENLAEITSLTVKSGTLNKDDFAFLSGTVLGEGASAATRYKPFYNAASNNLPENFVYLEGLKKIDLSGADCENDMIPGRAFWGNTQITSIILPKSVKRIGLAAFYGMTNLSYLSTDKTSNLYFDGVEILGESMVALDKALEGDLHLPSSLKQIGASCFANSGVGGEIVIGGNVDIVNNPDGVELEGATYLTSDSVFEGTNITSIEFQNGIIIIPTGFVGSCTSLSKIVLPDGLLEIGDTAFLATVGAGLSGTLVIPASVEKIGASAFSRNNKLDHIIVGNPNVQLSYASFANAKEGLKIYFTSAEATVNGEGDNKYWSLGNAEYGYGGEATILNTDAGVIANSNGKVTAELDTTTGLYTPTKEGYKFLGWYTDVDGKTTKLEGAAEAGKTYTAKWAKLYTVTFADADVDSVQVAEGKTVEEPEDPKKDEYKFDGWYTDKDCTAGNEFKFADDEDANTITADTTIYAKWTPYETKVDTDVKVNADPADKTVEITVDVTANADELDGAIATLNFTDANGNDDSANVAEVKVNGTKLEKDNNGKYTAEIANLMGTNVAPVATYAATVNGSATLTVTYKTAGTHNIGIVLYANNSDVICKREAKVEIAPEPGTLTLTACTAKLSDGTEVKNGDKVPVDAEVTVTFDKDFYADSNLVLSGWKVTPEDLTDTNGKLVKDITADSFTFTMPEAENGVTIEALTKTADTEDDSWDAATVITGVAIGAGAAVLTYHIGTELYAEQVLGKDVAVPKTREEVALKAWELAGKPAVELNGEPLSEAAQAEKWAVESGLMQNDAEGNFNGAKKMNKLKALRVLDSAKKMNAQ